MVEKDRTFTKNQVKSFFHNIEHGIHESFGKNRVNIRHKQDLSIGRGKAEYHDKPRSVSVSVGTRGLYEFQGLFKSSTVSETNFSKVAVAEIHESRHVAQRFGMVPGIGDVYFLTHDLNFDLYHDRYVFDLSELDAEWYGVREYGKWCECQFGLDELAVKYVRNRVNNDEEFYWLGREDFLKAGVDINSMTLSNISHVFEQKFGEALNMRYWYENRPNRNNDIIRQVLDMDNRDGFQKWGKVFDELCECDSFEESCRKISSLCLLGCPEKRVEYPGVKDLDANVEIKSFIPESSRSIRERCSGNPDAKRVYRVAQVQVQQKHGDAVTKARQLACNTARNPASMREPVYRPGFDPAMPRGFLPPPPVLPEDAPGLPGPGCDGPEF